MIVDAHDLCPFCTTPFKPAAAFCGSCGQRRPVQRDGRPIKLAILFYVALLLVAAAGMIVGLLTEDYFTTGVGITVMFAIVTLAFVLPNRALLADLSRGPGFSIGGYALILVASLPIVGAVAAYVHGLHGWFGIQLPSELTEFEGRSVLWPLLMVVVLPPLVEELAFRGVIYGGLRKSLRVGEAILVSSFAFAMLHLSVPSLVTHLPLGVYFCWLRYRSGSLWPAVFAHACHNLGVCILEWMHVT